MDEATSQIDIDLDDQVRPSNPYASYGDAHVQSSFFLSHQIQKTIREELSNALIITIAHRLKTIIDYDRILVLGEGGRILEYDTPKKLFYKLGGAFREMCRHSADWNELKQIIDSGEGDLK
jgi:ABC-type multidrug transport system ATPase subunit